MIDQTIRCEVCGSSVHAISIHISKEHGPGSATPITLAEYKERFPEAPLLSPAAVKKLKEKRESAEAQDEAPLSAKEPMGKLFGMERLKAVKKANGEDIMVSICQQTGNEHRIPRYKENFIYDVDILKSLLMAFEFNKPVYIYGHSGLGKTTIIKQICAATRRRMVRMQHTVNTQESDIVGQWTVAKEVHGDAVVSVTKFQLGPLAQCMLNGWVFVADEFDRAPPAVTSVYNAILEGDGEPLLIPDAPEEYRVIVPHPDFRLAATGNTNGSGDESGLYQATMQQDAATIERFACCVKVDYMPQKQETAMLRSAARIKAADAEKLVKFAADCRMRFPQDLSLNIGPRVLIEIAEQGVLRGSYTKGVELAYANRLPADERKAVLDAAQRTFGDSITSVEEAA